jgi:hypothetical protein
MKKMNTTQRTITRIITASNNFTLRKELRGSGMENGQPVAVWVTMEGLRVEPFQINKEYPEGNFMITRFTDADRLYVAPKLAEACGIGKHVAILPQRSGGFLISPMPG